MQMACPMCNGAGVVRPPASQAALGVEEAEVRAALEELEGEGLVYRAVAVRDSYRVTADGRDEAVARVRGEPAMSGADERPVDASAEVITARCKGAE